MTVRKIPLLLFSSILFFGLEWHVCLMRFSLRNRLFFIGNQSSYLKWRNSLLCTHVYRVYILWYICTEGTVSQSIPENKTNLFGTASVTKLTTYPVAEAEFLSRSYPPWTFFFFTSPFAFVCFPDPDLLCIPRRGFKFDYRNHFFFRVQATLELLLGSALDWRYPSLSNGELFGRFIACAPVYWL